MFNLSNYGMESKTIENHITEIWSAFVTKKYEGLYIFKYLDVKLYLS